MDRWIGLNKKLLKWLKLQDLVKVKYINGVGIRKRKMLKLNKLIKESLLGNNILTIISEMMMIKKINFIKIN